MNDTMMKRRTHTARPGGHEGRKEKALTGFNPSATMEAATRKGAASVAYDSESKKAWDKENMVFVGFKLFRRVKDSNNDQDIIDYLQGKERSKIIKQALREYMTTHPAPSASSDEV